MPTWLDVASALLELVKPDVNGYVFTPRDVVAIARSITTLLQNQTR